MDFLSLLHYSVSAILRRTIPGWNSFHSSIAPTPISNSDRNPQGRTLSGFASRFVRPFASFALSFHLRYPTLACPSSSDDARLEFVPFICRLFVPSFLHSSPPSLHRFFRPFASFAILLRWLQLLLSFHSFLSTNQL